MFDEKPIKELISSHQGGGTPSRQVPSFWNGAIPWASVKDFKDDSPILSQTEEHITSSGLRSSASHLIPAYTPMVCTRMAVGRIAISEHDVAINQDVKALFSRKDVHSQYLLRVMQFIQPLVERVAIGSTVMGIRIQDYLGINAPIAPSKDQPQIAKILDTLDTAIQRTEAIIEKLKQVKQGLLHDLLTRGIDANGELRPPADEAPELYQDSPLGRIPKAWTWSQVGRQFEIQLGKMLDAKGNSGILKLIFPRFHGPPV